MVECPSPKKQAVEFEYQDQVCATSVQRVNYPKQRLENVYTWRRHNDHVSTYFGSEAWERLKRVWRQFLDQHKHIKHLSMSHKITTESKQQNSHTSPTHSPMHCNRSSCSVLENNLKTKTDCKNKTRSKPNKWLDHMVGVLNFGQIAPRCKSLVWM